MGRVYQDKDRRRGTRKPWCLDYKDASGKRIREKTSATNKLQAEKILNERLSQVAKAEFLGIKTSEQLESIKFRTFVSDVYLPAFLANRKETTEISQLSLARTLVPVFGDRLIRDITVREILSYRDRRLTAQTRRGKKKRLSPSTVNREITFLSGVFQEAVTRGYLERNPCREFQRLPENNKRDRYLTRDEYDRIYAFLPNWLRPMVELAVYTGMRLGEVINVKRADIDWENCQIKLTKTKNNKTRYAPMNSNLEDTLRRIHPFMGPEGHSPYLFVNPQTGRPYFRTSPRASFVKAVKTAGIDDVTFHTLRHTFASWMIQAGVSKDVVQMILGHGSSHMTDRYAHLAPDAAVNTTEILVPKTGRKGKAAK